VSLVCGDLLKDVTVCNLGHPGNNVDKSSEQGAVIYIEAGMLKYI